jgi:DNA-directed RNA polymerase specialized sigma24 family protein
MKDRSTGIRSLLARFAIRARGVEEGLDMNTTEIATWLPGLRRYGRAMCGSQDLADRYLEIALVTLAERAESQSPFGRIDVYRVYNDVLQRLGDSPLASDPPAPAEAPDRQMTAAAGLPDADAMGGMPAPDPDPVDARLQGLAPLDRATVVLSSLEDLSDEAIGGILSMSVAEVAARRAVGRLRLAGRPVDSAILALEGASQEMASTAAGILDHIGIRRLQHAPDLPTALGRVSQRPGSLLVGDLGKAIAHLGTDRDGCPRYDASHPVLWLADRAEDVVVPLRPSRNAAVVTVHDRTTFLAGIAHALDGIHEAGTSLH